MAITVGELLARAKRLLGQALEDASSREANLLLAHVLGLTEAGLLARDEHTVESAARDSFEALVARRAQGEPVAYLLGRREFYGRDFEVDPRVLIPRPETEHLVDAALAAALPDMPRILDVGTGSGCLAITLALEIPGARVIASDRSPGALCVARRNATRLGADRALTLVCTDWLAAVAPRHLDLVVTNPPYIARGESSAISHEITDFEPHPALFAGEDGLAAYREILASLADLCPGTPVIAEIGRHQHEAVLDLATRCGFRHLHTVDDYSGIPRVVVVNRS